MMDIKQLIYFLAIAEEDSITKAAARLHMAQPPLSKQLKMLEDELEVKLFERNTRNLKITDVGKRLQYRAKQIIELTETTISELKDYDEGSRGTLRIGTLASTGDAILPIRIYNFNQLYPNISFQIKHRSTPEILDMLKKGLIDIGIVRTPINSEYYDSILLPEEPMVAVTAGTPLWEKNESSITLSDLADQPLLVLNRYENIITQACRNAGFEPNILGKIDDTKSILLWANLGIGTAIVQRDWLELFKNADLKYKEISEASLVTQTAIVWMKNQYMSSASRHFLETFLTD
ncbi:LysR family transcriptional regulator [Peribacillus sp. NPDC097895]|uniref:LysR family transcriptional regulator n=1 Tax=Peribacillus sp. NPDC097895 TaxID=3390619 RepID=UPI003D00D687